MHTYVYYQGRLTTAFIEWAKKTTSGGFPLVVDPRRRGLGAQPPAAEEVLILNGI